MSLLSSPLKIVLSSCDIRLRCSNLLSISKWVTHFTPYSNKKIEVLEVTDMDSLITKAITEGSIEPFGAVSWKSSEIAVMQLDYKYRNGLNNKIICDIGCGTGIVTCASVALGATYVHSLDLNEDSLCLTRMAVEKILQPGFCNLDKNTVYQTSPREQNQMKPLNYLSEICTLSTFDLLEVDNNYVKLPINCNIVVMSDICYYPDLARAAAKRAVEAFINGADVLVTDPGRSTQKDFLQELSSHTAAMYLTSSLGRKANVDNHVNSTSIFLGKNSEITSTTYSESYHRRLQHLRDYTKDLKFTPTELIDRKKNSSADDELSSRQPEDCGTIDGYYLWLLQYID